MQSLLTESDALYFFGVYLALHTLVKTEAEMGATGTGPDFVLLSVRNTRNTPLPI